ncbi:MAG: polymer-forming cytoskeletal protein [candidate division Zixibacteria bacterium]|nr:polymer-forming cytoskeletal protein [candidate division Zixibacteria bacterium]
MPRIRNISLLATAIILIACGSVLFNTAYGAVFKSGKDIEISKLHQLDNDFYVYGDNLLIDGTIKGDLLAFVNKATIRGNLESSANIGTTELVHQGVINGTLRVFAQRAEIYGHVSRSVLIFGQIVKLYQGSMVLKDVDLYASEVNLEGTVSGNARIYADTLYFSGIIEGNLDIDADRITIAPPAVIKGNLTYSSKNEVVIESPAGVTIVGTTTWNLPEEEKKAKSDINLTSILIRLSCMLATFFFAILIFKIFRPYAVESFNQLKNSFGASFAAGVVGLLIIIFCFLILLVSVGLFLAGIILISSDYFFPGSLLLVIFTLLIPITSFASVSGGVIFYSGKIIVAALIGHFIIGRLRSRHKILSSTSLFLGLVILLILFSIPYLGLYFYLLAGITGSGAIFLGIKKCNRQKNSEASIKTLEKPPDPVSQ